MESFEEERPFIRAEMNGLGRLSHEWVRCLEWIDPVRFYKWSQGANPCFAPTTSNLPMKKETSAQTTWHMEGKSFVCMSGGLISVNDKVDRESEEIRLWVGADSLNDAIDRYFPYCDRSTQERFIQTLTAAIRKVDNVEA